MYKYWQRKKLLSRILCVLYLVCLEQQYSSKKSNEYTAEEKSTFTTLCANICTMEKHNIDITKEN